VAIAWLGRGLGGRLLGIFGQIDGKRGSFPFALAVGVNAATVKLDEVADNGEAQAQAAMRAGGGTIGLAESVEDVREKAGLDAFAGIGNAYPHTPLFRSTATRTLPPDGVNLIALLRRFHTTC